MKSRQIRRPLVPLSSWKRVIPSKTAKAEIRKKKYPVGGNQDWTGDLSICSRMLYHWAIPPCGDFELIKADIICRPRSLHQNFNLVRGQFILVFLFSGGNTFFAFERMVSHRKALVTAQNLVKSEVRLIGRFRVNPIIVACTDNNNNNNLLTYIAQISCGYDHLRITL